MPVFGRAAAIMIIALALVGVIFLVPTGCGRDSESPDGRVSDVRLFETTLPSGATCVVAESRYNDAGIALSCDWSR